MTELTNLLKHFNIDTKLLSEMSTAELRVKSYNNSKGNLTGYDCSECNNRGDFLCLEDGREFFRKCKCSAIRKSYNLIEKSGMKDMFERYTFTNYNTQYKWQYDMRKTAGLFAQNPAGWFFVGGQPGCGKTHLCTAIANILIQRGKEVKYMPWRDESVVLKGTITDPEAYIGIINPYKKAEVLFIDDFLKAPPGKLSPADISIAYEIINYRYNNRELITLISSEMTLVDICELDAATGSRIVEMTGPYAMDVPKDAAKNYRMQKKECKLIPEN